MSRYASHRLGDRERGDRLSPGDDPRQVPKAVRRQAPKGDPHQAPGCRAGRADGWHSQDAWYAADMVYAARLCRRQRRDVAGMLCRRQSSSQSTAAQEHLWLPLSVGVRRARSPDADAAERARCHCQTHSGG